MAVDCEKTVPRKRRNGCQHISQFVSGRFVLVNFESEVSERQISSQSVQYVWNSIDCLYDDHYCEFPGHCSMETNNDSGAPTTKLDTEVLRPYHTYTL
ncbi:hypothetical protein TNCV_4573151 [Trichonephila clavipes]|nr:hypothetical protein TNCV_4573151 [Trichonephila clavipes]